MPVPRCLMFKEVITMEVEFFDTAEEAAERLTKAMKAADARVQHWQAQVKPGDCFMSDSGEGFPVFGEVLEDYPRGAPAALPVLPVLLSGLSRR